MGKEKDLEFDVSIPKEAEERNKEFNEYVSEKTPKTNHVRNLILAFMIGGIICILGQIIFDVAGMFIKDEKAIGDIVVILLIFLGSFLTGIGVYDKLGKYAGAGSVVPITGFANSITSPAIEFKKEGLVFGLGAKMLIIGGPVLVNGIAASIVVALIRLMIGI